MHDQWRGRTKRQRCAVAGPPRAVTLVLPMQTGGQRAGTRDRSAEQLQSRGGILQNGWQHPASSDPCGSARARICHQTFREAADASPAIRRRRPARSHRCSGRTLPSSMPGRSEDRTAPQPLPAIGADRQTRARRGGVTVDIHDDDRRIALLAMLDLRQRTAGSAGIGRAKRSTAATLRDIGRRLHIPGLQCACSGVIDDRRRPGMQIVSAGGERRPLRTAQHNQDDDDRHPPSQQQHPPRRVAFGISGDERSWHH